MIDKIIVKTYFMEDGNIVQKDGGAVQVKAAIDKDYAVVDQLFDICKKETKQRMKSYINNEN